MLSSPGPFQNCTDCGSAGRVYYRPARHDQKIIRYTEGPWSISATSLQAALVSYQDKEYMQRR